MDPESYTTSLFKWDYRTGLVQPSNRTIEPVVAQQPTSANPTMTTTTTTSAYCILRPREMDGLDEFLQPYGIRYYTAAKIAELGFTVNTLLGMKDEELDDMMNSLCQIFHWDLLVGERYGIKAAVRSERRRLDDDEIHSRYLISASDTPTTTLDAFSQEGLSEEPVQQQKEIVGIVGGATWDDKRKKQQKKSKLSHKKLVVDHRETVEGDHENDNEDNVVMNYHDDAYGELNERQREHPFIVTEPGEVARGKKNGLDYLFHLYDQCRAFLIQVQNIAKERGEKCPTKVTNQVFRYAKKAGACYINKPKMRHYVHCYALHCLDEEGSNALRRAFKERGENVGSWRQACYKPLVALAAQQGWDIDAIFNTHPLLSIWYVPTKLRQLCHAERSRATASSSVTTAAAAAHLLSF